MDKNIIKLLTNIPKRITIIAESKGEDWDLDLYAFIDNKQIHIDDLVKLADEKVKQKFKCINGHPLIFANGKKNKPLNNSINQ